MFNRRSFLQGASTLALAQVLNGCTTKESSLSVFLLEGSIPLRLIKDFRKTIAKENVDFKSETNLKNLLKLLETWRKNPSPPASSFSISLPFTEKSVPRRGNLVTLGDTWLSAAIREGLIQPLDPAQLSYWPQLPPRWRSLVTLDQQGQEDEGGKIWGAPYRWGTTVIAYNEEKLRSFPWRPQDWSDLWHQELRGRIALVDNAREVIGLTLKKLGYSYNVSDLASIPTLPPTLAALQKQVRFYSSQYYLQPLLVGDVWLSVGWSDDILPLSEQYPEIKVVVPRSGSSLWSDVWVKPSSTETNPLARQWIDFCWQTESVDRISRFTDGLSPMIFNQPADRLPADIQNNPLLKDREAIERSEFLSPLSSKTQQEYDRLWAEMRRSV
jgi:putative spermidine/putrescine transport system substrate-binding protein